jgi:UTP--glucose-1-phosphate uridylyltransferase
VLCARPAIGDEPFGVVLPDDLILNGSAAHPAPGALRQMAELAHAEHAGVIAVEEVPREQTDRYGIVDATPVSERAARVRMVVEKPRPADAPTNLAIVGRYVLPARILDLLESTRPGAGGEIQLTDAIQALLAEQPVLAYRFEGTRYDCGNKLGMVRATLAMALQDPDLAEPTRALFRELAG